MDGNILEEEGDLDETDMHAAKSAAEVLGAMLSINSPLSDTAAAEGSGAGRSQPKRSPARRDECSDSESDYDGEDEIAQPPAARPRAPKKAKAQQKLKGQLEVKGQQGAPNPPSG